MPPTPGKRADEGVFDAFRYGIFAGGGVRPFANAGVEAAYGQACDGRLGVVDRSGLDDLEENGERAIVALQSERAKGPLSVCCQTTRIWMVTLGMKRSEAEESNPLLTPQSRSQIRVMPKGLRVCAPRVRLPAPRGAQRSPGSYPKLRATFVKSLSTPRGAGGALTGKQSPPPPSPPHAK